MTPSERFEALFRSHYGAILRYARRRTDDEQLAEDVAAETFAIAWRRLDRVPADPLPWLYRVAGHELSNRRRAVASERAKQAGARVLDGAGRDPAEALAERDAVVRAFAALNERDRESLRLVAWEGLSLADGARAAGTTRLAFAMRVSRARRRLLVELAGADGVVHVGPKVTLRRSEGGAVRDFIDRNAQGFVAGFRSDYERGRLDDAGEVSFLGRPARGYVVSSGGGRMEYFLDAASGAPLGSRLTGRVLSGRGVPPQTLHTVTTVDVLDSLPATPANRARVTG